MVDEGYGQRCTAAAGRRSGQPAWLRTSSTSSTWCRSAAMTRHADERSRPRAQPAPCGATSDAWRAILRDLASADEIPAYIWLAFACASRDAATSRPTRLLAPTRRAARHAAASSSRRATCRGIRAGSARARCSKADPRWIEIEIFPGLVPRRADGVGGRTSSTKPTRLFSEAYAWHPRWPALTQSIANVAMTARSSSAPALFYDETLTIEPRASTRCSARCGR